MRHRRAVRKTLIDFARRLRNLLTNPIFIALTIFGNAVIFFAATSLYFLERGENPSVTSFLDTLWWAVSTVTTVGYGDVSPVTPPGRVIGIGLMIVGTALFWSYTALFAEALVREDITDLESSIRRLRKQLTLIPKNQRSNEIQNLLTDLHEHLAGQNNPSKDANVPSIPPTASETS